MYLNILTSFPPSVTNHAVFIRYVKCKTTTVCKRIGLVTGGGGGGGKHFSKTFSIFYVLNSKNRVFNPYFLNRYLSNEKNTFANNSRVEPTIFLMEKLLYSLKLFSGHFYGQSFIKIIMHMCCLSLLMFSSNSWMFNCYTLHIGPLRQSISLVPGTVS